MSQYCLSGEIKLWLESRHIFEIHDGLIKPIPHEILHRLDLESVYIFENSPFHAKLRSFDLMWPSFAPVY